MNNKKPFVTIIIANYNGEKYLSTCLNSVLATKYTLFEVLLVDDGSTDRSVQIIKRFVAKDKRIQLLKNDRNLGAAASRNLAAKVANGEILVFLDNDTEVTPLWITEMVKTLSENRKIGGCQALLMDFERRDTVQVAGTKIWAATGWGLPIGAGEKSKDKFKEIDIIALSAALAIRKDIFEKVGGFDEMEAVVTEDLDLSWRIWIAGYKVVLSPKSIVYHWTKSVAMRKNMKHTNEKIYFHLTKNSLISIIKNYELKTLMLYLPYAVFIHISRSIIVSICKWNSSSIKGTVRAFLWTLNNLNYIFDNRNKISSIRKNNDKTLFSKIVLKKTVFFIVKNNFNVS